MRGQNIALDEENQMSKIWYDWRKNDGDQMETQCRAMMWSMKFKENWPKMQ